MLQRRHFSMVSWKQIWPASTATCAVWSGGPCMPLHPLACSWRGQPVVRSRGHNHQPSDPGIADADLAYKIDWLHVCLATSQPLTLQFTPHNHLIRMEQLLVQCLLKPAITLIWASSCFLFPFTLALCYFLTLPFQQPRKYLKKLPLLFIQFSLILVVQSAWCSWYLCISLSISVPHPSLPSVSPTLSLSLCPYGLQYYVLLKLLMLLMFDVFYLPVFLPCFLAVVLCCCCFLVFFCVWWAF